MPKIGFALHHAATNPAVRAAETGMKEEEREDAMNIRAACAVFSMAAGLFSKNRLAQKASKAIAKQPNPACFPKGTLVHTQNGLVPIEQIKVGDMVLSKHESGEGEQAYKPVTRVFEHGPTRVIKLSYLEDVEKPSFGGRVFTTLNHPFWVDGKGWTEARLLKFWDGKASIPTYSGQAVRSAGIGRIAATSKPGIGWMAMGADVIDDFGFEWDFDNNVLVGSRVYAEEDASFEDNPMQVPVWNLEVADFHTYYVGKHGLWVHNKNKEATSLTA